MNETVIINATNLGKHLDGIGTYALNLVRELSRAKTTRRFLVYVNRPGTVHLEGLHFPTNVKIVRVSGLVSPDHGFRGHLLRLLFANYLSLRHPRKLIFSTSQLEAVVFRKKQVVMIHDLIPLYYKSNHKKQYPYFKYVLPHALRRAKAIVTPSQHTRQLLHRAYGIEPEKVAVIPHGVGEEFRPSDGAVRTLGMPYILFIGRITQMKNLDGIMRAFAIIQEKIPHNLVLIGEEKLNGERRFSTQAFAGYGISPGRIAVKGYITTGEMVEILRKASLLVFPSLYEGFGLPAVEAMAVGCPVVTSDVASLPEVCGDAALYVNPHDPCSIAEGTRKVLTDHALRQQMVRKGLRLVKNYRWERSLIRHLQVIEEAIGGVKPLHRPAASFEVQPRTVPLLPQS